MLAVKAVSAAISPVAARSPQPILPFDVSPSHDAREEAVAAIPQKFKPYVEKWCGITADCTNGTWRKWQGLVFGGVLVKNNDDYRRGLARMWDVSQRTVYQKLALFQAINHDPKIPAKRRWLRFAEALLPRPRPGRAGHGFFDQPENDWMFGKLRDFYLNQAKLSMRAAHELLLLEIQKKQAAWGVGHLYDRPTLDQSLTALARLTKAEKTLGREGEKAFDDQCGKYLSRAPNTLRANDLWVTDQQEWDIRMRDGGEHLGRIWMVNFQDVATDKVLGYAFGPILSSDMVMMAATMAIERYGVPGAIHMDLGKEFICKAFNGGVRKFSGEVLYREAQGLWNYMGSKIVKAIGSNPKTKTDERWHRIVAEKFYKRFPGYCGSNIDERPEKLVDEEAQHLAWLAGKRERTPLVTIGQGIRAYINWVESDWNGKARGRGKMRRGMTPNEAYNVKRPADGFRTISAAELDHASADHRFVKIARGGQVNLTFFGQTLEYEAPELFHLQGEQVEAIVSRRTFRQITVLYPIAGGTGNCVATLKPQLAWLPENRDELRAAMRCKAAVHRAVRQGLKASRVALEAANPVELLEQQKALPAKEIVGSQKFFADSPLGHPEMGSLEYQAQRMGVKGHRRQQTSEEVADAALRSMQEDKNAEKDTDHGSQENCG
jgi:transposase InsO family protein